MKELIRTALTIAFFGSLLIVCEGRTSVPASSKTYNVDNTRIRVLIPPEMNVAMTPQRLDTGKGSPLLYYKFKVLGRETAHVLRWNVYVSDAGGKLVSKDSWFDAGEWSPGSEVDESTIFDYDSKPGTKLTIVLREMVDESGIRRISEKALEQNLERILVRGPALPQPRFIAHADVSDEEGEELFKRSLNFILTKEAFKNDLKLTLPALIIMPDGSNVAPPLPNTQVISKEFVKERLRVGESVRYFEYTGFGSYGNNATVSILYHTPRVVANSDLHVETGLILNFTYRKQQSGFALKEIGEVHF